MPTPGSIADLSVTASSNSPAGSESNTAGSVDDYFRAYAAVIRQGDARTSGVASAATVDLSAYANRHLVITGTTTITGLGTVGDGILKVLRFSGALTLTHNATSLILPGGANITTAAGDVAFMLSEGSGNWRCLAYTRASGLSVIAPVANSGGSDSYFSAIAATTTRYGSDGTGGHVSVQGSNPLRTIINGTEASRTDASRRFLVNTSAPVSGTDCKVSVVGATNSVNGIQVQESTGGSASARYFMGFYNAGNTAVGSIYTTDGSSTVFATSSDRRLKDDIADAPDFGATIDRVRIRTFRWKDYGSQGIGVIAQELAEVLPDLVSDSPDGMLQVNYTGLIPYHHRELQSLRERMRTLEGLVTALAERG